MNKPGVWINKITGAMFLICSLALGLSLSVRAETKSGEEGVSARETGEEALLFAGALKGSGKNRELTYFFTRHAGGKVEGDLFCEGGYIYVELEEPESPPGTEHETEVGPEAPVYLVFSSASGGPQWVQIYAEEWGENPEGVQYAIFSYESCSAGFGEDFARWDILYLYSNTSGEVTVKQICYFPGTGEREAGDGTWDRPLTGIAFIGDSIVQNPIFQYGDWNTILGREDCVNYGIGSQTTVEVAARWGDLLKGNYEKIVILCGINDLGHGRQLFSTIGNYRKMFESTHETYPETEIFVISILPTTDAFFKDSQSKITYMNAALKNIINEYDYVTFVDVHSSFVQEDGYCNPDYVSDGLHPNQEGYQVIAEVLTPYLNGERINTVEDPSVEAGNLKEELEGTAAPQESSTSLSVMITVSIVMLALLGAALYFFNKKSQS